ncbi:unnamed protein product [Paramecium octaurelia]|uniref:Poly [ADP-ribose] polymerase n=1 Tax=Paramecium octaurelia TaxID=43137 RepID=A0A8S1UZB6_PAROT|nr:unnamed protein product [Paramecium octaurelia]
MKVEIFLTITTQSQIQQLSWLIQILKIMNQFKSMLIILMEVLILLYNLKILEIFKIKRKGEKDKFKNVGNRMLLWHGSRLTKFVGIMSQGLRIAPHEAPCTGYMFGKGVYFADSVSKSANYCCASSSNPVGLILLCNERTEADYEASNLEPDCQSTKGIGKMAPDETVEFQDMKVLIGKPEDQQLKSDLMCNQYIVYNVDQVRIKYFVKLEFLYKQQMK